MRLVPNWRKAWRWFSVQGMALGVALQGAWLSIPEDMKASVPQEWVAAITMALLALGIIGRLVDQGE